jgi:hypothetical protein
MTMTTEERSFVTTAIFSVAVGLSFLGTGLGVGIAYLEKKATAQFANSGDTPVVLVGGTLTFKAGDKTYPWVPDTQYTTFHVSPTYAVATIVIKARAGSDPNDNPVGDDSDSTTDLFRIDVFNSTSWEIDEFISDGTKVATITPQGNSIYLTRNGPGYLCPDPNGNLKKISYSQTPSCPGTPVSFSKISFTVTDTINGALQTVASGTLNCIDSTGSPGTCRIAFRGP